MCDRNDDLEVIFIDEETLTEGEILEEDYYEPEDQ